MAEEVVEQPLHQGDHRQEEEGSRRKRLCLEWQVNALFCCLILTFYENLQLGTI